MGGEVVLVAVDASKKMTDYALEWALRNVIQATDSLIFLAILPSHSLPPAPGNFRKHQSGIRQFFACIRNTFRNKTEEFTDQMGLVGGEICQDGGYHRITEVCVQMMRQLCVANNVRQVQTKVNVVADAPLGSIATKAEDLGATWVILDRRLANEGDYCLNQLTCNIVIVDHTIPKFLRSVGSESNRKSNLGVHQNEPMLADMLGVFPIDSKSPITSSSLDFSSKSPRTDGSYSLSSSKQDNLKKTTNLITNVRSSNTCVHQYTQFVHKVRTEDKMYPTSPYRQAKPASKINIFDIDESLSKSIASPKKERTKSYSGLLSTHMNKGNNDMLPTAALIPARRSVDTPRFRRQLTMSKQTSKNWRRHSGPISPSSPIDRTSSIRKTMSVSIKQPPIPPPLCSVCKYNAPIFGKPPRKFTYEEIEMATEGFSSANFLAEGGYGPVYRGIMPDGQVVAVKQHKLDTAQGASEFCSEVEILSCAQHRNLVMLVGYCTDPEWLLVYEFACNGSLDKHLFKETEKQEVMSWENRMKVAIGIARGLRYLHEDCRVGCIIHRDLRPKNILLTHDFEPIVGDFGLARLQADGQSAEETRVIGAFGYLAPEYTQTGLITEKADVYAFGVVLLELLSGLKATDPSRSQEQQYLPEWCQALVEKQKLNEIIDPRLESDYIDKEVLAMLHSASLCILPDPEGRPRMSKVLRLLEGEMPRDMAYQHGSGEPSSAFQKNNSYSEGRPLLGRTHPHRRNHSTLPPIQSMHHLKPSSVSPRAYKVDSHNMNIVPATSSGYYGMERLSNYSRINQQEETVSQEYQTYLKGSLVEFIHNMN